MAISRRAFLGTTALGSLGLKAGAGTVMPMRPFGKTGIDVPLLAFGAGSRFVSYETDDEALAVLGRAIDLGLTYIDTAHSYGNGKSEERIGQLMPTRRKEVILATKLGGRTADEAKQQLELSLKRLRSGSVDVVHIHNLADADDLAAIEKKGGVLEALLEAREQKITRFIGVSAHNDPMALKTALERHDFDCVQMALNIARSRMTWDDAGKAQSIPLHDGSFEGLALPVAKAKGMGVIAMKIFGQEQLLGQATVEKLVYYALSLPVSLASLGMPKPEMLEENAALARRFQPLPEAEMQRLRDTVPEERKVAFARFLHHHADV
jgi:aryl-alcohol dehydrogenase-like predicted oxidoreductase